MDKLEKQYPRNKIFCRFWWMFYARQGTVIWVSLLQIHFKNVFHFMMNVYIAVSYISSPDFWSPKFLFSNTNRFLILRIHFGSLYILKIWFSKTFFNLHPPYILLPLSFHTRLYDFTQSYAVWIQINRKSVHNIWFRFDSSSSFTFPLCTLTDFPMTNYIRA